MHQNRTRCYLRKHCISIKKRAVVIANYCSKGEIFKLFINKPKPVNLLTAFGIQAEKYLIFYLKIFGTFLLFLGHPLS